MSYLYYAVLCNSLENNVMESPNNKMHTFFKQQNRIFPSTKQGPQIYPFLIFIFYTRITKRTIIQNIFIPVFIFHFTFNCRDKFIVNKEEKK